MQTLPVYPGVSRLGKEFSYTFLGDGGWGRGEVEKE